MCKCRYLDLLESVSPESAVTAKAQIVYEKKKLEDMVLPKLVASPKLDDIVKPKTRQEGVLVHHLHALHMLLAPFAH